MCFDVDMKIKEMPDVKIVYKLVSKRGGRYFSPICPPEMSLEYKLGEIKECIFVQAYKEIKWDDDLPADIEAQSGIYVYKERARAIHEQHNESAVTVLQCEVDPADFLCAEANLFSLPQKMTYRKVKPIREIYPGMKED